MNKRQGEYEEKEEDSSAKRMRIFFDMNTIEENHQIPPSQFEEIETGEMEREPESDSAERRVCIYQYFQSYSEVHHPPSGSLITPLCGTCDSIIDEDEAMVMLRCQFCSHAGCSKCTPQCCVCGERFCKNCSLQNYDLPFERTICIDCNCSNR